MTTTRPVQTGTSYTYRCPLCATAQDSDENTYQAEWGNDAAVAWTCTGCDEHVEINFHLIDQGDSPVTEAELYAAIVRLCQEYGYTSEHTYDLIQNVIDSIDTEGTDGHPIGC